MSGCVCVCVCVCVCDVCMLCDVACLPCRLVTITGNRESICKAFEAIGVKIEQVSGECAWVWSCTCVGELWVWSCSGMLGSLPKWCGCVIPSGLTSCTHDHVYRCR